MSLVNAILAADLAVCLLAAGLWRHRAARAERRLDALAATTTQLQHLADHDPLTGLLNRRRFAQEVARHLAHVRRYGPDGAVLLLDLDRFKPVNDTHGHAAGDRLLTHVAQALQARLRASDAVARLGGDEFAILLSRADGAAAATVAQHLVETVRAAGAVTVSIGVMPFDERVLGADDVLAAADRALYRAKTAGGDAYALHDPPAAPGASLRAPLAALA